MLCLGLQHEGDIEMSKLPYEIYDEATANTYGGGQSVRCFGSEADAIGWVTHISNTKPQWHGPYPLEVLDK